MTDDVTTYRNAIGCKISQNKWRDSLSGTCANVWVHFHELWRGDLPALLYCPRWIMLICWWCPWPCTVFRFRFRLLVNILSRNQVSSSKSFMLMKFPSRWARFSKIIGLNAWYCYLDEEFPIHRKTAILLFQTAMIPVLSFCMWTLNVLAMYW